MPETPHSRERYSRLERYAPLARVLPAWQAASCAVLGLGGLGGALAPQLARLGVRQLTLIDRDIVRPENLGHQQLFTEADAAAALPKAEAAATHLRRLNSDVEVTALCTELNRLNIREVLGGATLLFDGLDNYYTRLLLNDYAYASGKPYLYAGVVSGQLSARAVIPGRTGCLRCLVDTPPLPGTIPTCSTAGVFPPLLGLAALLQLELARRWLAGEVEDILYSFSMDSLQMKQTRLQPRADCPVCSSAPGTGRYDYLDGVFDERAASACDSSRQQLELGTALDLEQAHKALAAAGDFKLVLNAFCLSAERGALRFTLFPAGRIVLEGSVDPAVLNAFRDTYLGG